MVYIIKGMPFLSHIKNNIPQAYSFVFWFASWLLVFSLTFLLKNQSQENKNKNELHLSHLKAQTV